ncbi:hypothetical protein CEJ98_06990 [Burkholderia gladioli pv. gladioli]|nr:hypothetical protein CEJ98_06990 [Burkholderia gladioli pv. gladioli]AWY55978.1 hypothetical protein A8H28_34160 [Burkholderia gladioli pv. gladioli]PRH37654.1 hypothetical protein C6V07_02520 [Burkholderia gladioli]
MDSFRFFSRSESSRERRITRLLDRFISDASVIFSDRSVEAFFIEKASDSIFPRSLLMNAMCSVFFLIFLFSELIDF